MKTVLPAVTSSNDSGDNETDLLAETAAGNDTNKNFSRKLVRNRGTRPVSPRVRASMVTKKKQGGQRKNDKKNGSAVSDDRRLDDWYELRTNAYEVETLRARGRTSTHTGSQIQIVHLRVSSGSQSHAAQRRDRWRRTMMMAHSLVQKPGVNQFCYCNV